MNAHRPGNSKIWSPARGRHRATMVEGRASVVDGRDHVTLAEGFPGGPAAAKRHRVTVIDSLRRHGAWPSRNPWMPALAASRERVVGSAVLRASGNLL